MKFELTNTYNFEGAFRGLRNPLNSWDKSDSKWENNKYIIGANDMGLAQRLIKAGPEHMKFMRQIFVCVDITAPLYWWKEFDTYKVGTTANSTSTMHKLTSYPITTEMFEWDGKLTMYEEAIMDMCEDLRQRYVKTKDQDYWRALVQILPEAWLQTRTVTLSYANLRTIYFQRRNHKLKEWSNNFCDWVKTLPYAEELIMLEDK